MKPRTATLSAATTLLCVSLILLGENTLATSYGDILGKSLIENLIDEKERGDWRPVAYPTDNFGVGTLYDGTGAGTLLCDTARCLGLPDNKTETLNAKGFIAFGEGAAVNLSDEQKKSLTISAVLPKVFAILGLSGKYDSKKVVVTEAQLGSAVIRRAVKGEIGKQITDHPPTAATTTANQQHRIRAVVADLVVQSMLAKVKLDQSTAAEVKATLEANVGKVLGKDASFEFQLGGGQNGTYELKVTRPLIAAVAVKKQPRTGLLSSAEDSGWSSWSRDSQIKLKTDNEQ
jgi:hypothetical protein